MTNQITLASPSKMRALVSNESVQKQLNSMITDKNRRDQLATSMVAMVQQNPTIQDCELISVYNSALAGASLNMPYGFGYWYAVPFNDKKRNIKQAQFQIGYKGYIQLAIRSGQYKKIIASEIKEGELISFNPITEEVNLAPITNPTDREESKTIGYYGLIELISGFKKEIYWPKEKMENHADKYSPAFKLDMYNKLLAGKIVDKDLWKYSSFWYKNFDEMAKKTIIRQIISKFGVMSVEMEKAYQYDGSSLESDENNNLIPNYIQEDDTPEPKKIDKKSQKQLEFDKDTGEIEESKEVDSNVDSEYPSFE